MILTSIAENITVGASRTAYVLPKATVYAWYSWLNKTISSSEVKLVYLEF